MKLRYFLIFESLAVALLLLALWGGVAAHSWPETFAPVLRILPIAPAIVAAILPILYFALPARVPREESSNP